MNMQKVVEERLYNLAKDEASLIRMKEKIQSLESECGAIRAARTDGDPVTGGGNGRCEWLDNNIQERTYLKLRIEAVERDVASLRAALGMLPLEQQRVLDVFFINRRSNPERYLAEALNAEERTVWRWRKQAVSGLAHLLYGGIEV